MSGQAFLRLQARQAVPLVLGRTSTSVPVPDFLDRVCRSRKIVFYVHALMKNTYHIEVVFRFFEEDDVSADFEFPVFGENIGRL